MEKLLVDWVEISSHTADVEGCTLMARALRGASQRLLGDRARVTLHPSASKKFGEHFELAVDGPGAPILLVGHHDTVFPKSVFAGARRDGELLRGPGTLDMKGGLVVVLHALAALARADLLGKRAIRVLSVSDEEVGSPEGREHVLRLAKGAEAALVFESGRPNDLIITQRKGVGAVTIRARGKAAHAGNAHAEGANAIWALARFCDRVQALTDYARGVTVNVGKISGGIGKNTVPDSAEALLDFRVVTRADGDELTARFQEIAQQCASSVPGTTVTISGGIARQPLERTDASAQLLASYAKHARAHGLGADEAPLLGGGSDANTVAELGVPAIDGLGPRGRGFHTTDEHIEVATLVPKTQALASYLGDTFRSPTSDIR